MLYFVVFCPFLPSLSENRETRASRVAPRPDHRQEHENAAVSESDGGPTVEGSFDGSHQCLNVLHLLCDSSIGCNECFPGSDLLVQILYRHGGTNGLHHLHACSAHIPLALLGRCSPPFSFRLREDRLKVTSCYQPQRQRQGHSCGELEGANLVNGACVSKNKVLVGCILGGVHVVALRSACRSCLCQQAGAYSSGQDQALCVYLSGSTALIRVAFLLASSRCNTCVAEMRVVLCTDLCTQRVAPVTKHHKGRMRRTSSRVLASSMVRATSKGSLGSIPATPAQYIEMAADWVSLLPSSSSKNGACNNKLTGSYRSIVPVCGVGPLDQLVYSRVAMLTSHRWCKSVTTSALGTQHTHNI